jgi:hypothetical protein
VRIRCSVNVFTQPLPWNCRSLFSQCLATRLYATIVTNVSLTHNKQIVTNCLRTNYITKSRTCCESGDGAGDVLPAQTYRTLETAVKCRFRRRQSGKLAGKLIQNYFVLYTKSHRIELDSPRRLAAYARCTTCALAVNCDDTKATRLWRHFIFSTLKIQSLTMSDRSRHGRALAQTACRRLSTMAARVWCQVMWDLWLTEWHSRIFRFLLPLLTSQNALHPGPVQWEYYWPA